MVTQNDNHNALFNINQIYKLTNNSLFSLVSNTIASFMVYKNYMLSNIIKDMKYNFVFVEFLVHKFLFFRLSTY